jgi:hypothetical protein
MIALAQRNNCLQSLQLTRLQGVDSKFWLRLLQSLRSNSNLTIQDLDLSHNQCVQIVGRACAPCHMLHPSPPLPRVRGITPRVARRWSARLGDTVAAGWGDTAATMVLGLSSLALADCGITGKGAIALLAGLSKNPTVQTGLQLLDVSSNAIGPVRR